MNPHSECTPMKNKKRAKKALYQRERRVNPVVRSLEQSSDTVRRAIVHTDQGVREQEQSADTVRQAIVRTDQGVREHESEQRAAAREEPGVREHESEQCAAAREELGVREQEQSANTVRRAIVRTDQEETRPELVLGKRD